jgi:endo-1,4-beta-xylanase
VRRPRPLIALAVAGATALLGGQLVITNSASAAPSLASQKATYPADSLRALAAKTGLRFGTAVNADELGTNAAYTQVVADQFSTVTPENAMKWGEVEASKGTLTWSKADALVAFAKQNKQLVRGHTLVWHNQLPSWLSTDGNTTTYTNAQVKSLLKRHIQDQVTHFKGQIWQWDVVNEVIDDNGQPRQDIFYKAWGGTGYIADAFKWAHQADPKALLFYNDYNLEFTGAKSDAAYALVKSLKAQGVPIDGVGFQGHLSTQYGYPDIDNNLARFSQLGLKVALTEVDVRTLTKADAVNTPIDALAPYAQESYWSRTLKACLAVKACISFTPWGFADNYSWVPGVFSNPQEGAALIYDENLKPKGSYTVMQQDLALAAGAPHRNGR